MEIREGYFDYFLDRSEDCDHGPCTEYTVPELGMRFYLYDNHKLMVSFHEEDEQ